ncbi:protocatechuate 3,4-dioxygenase subunit alpha [Emticicia sp. BO119]|uniref:protocatechuate 3,4-dioxygenase subunit alpha n=1 Tax=Emticicia sp. BO119 TaxID=2757768 RepID=UPI0015F00314|nr:protocatechuate 3,4-dioxygenase subunit alpha [Emticicia sp. BO119]MBA4850266.1 protocatechuate 3,4-dioxygenase subunit alpha [Emticicia sp. BO119]
MRQTPSQTVGPYFAYGLTPEQYLYDFKSLVGNEMVSPLDHDRAITIVGKVFDGQGVVISDAMIEIWQNDGQNQLFGRFGTGTDAESRFIFHTIKPASVNGQAPYLSVIIFMRGQQIHSYTRIYFSDETDLNTKDAVLSLVPEDRRDTLIAKNKGNIYEFNIYMQGENETVFFDI